MPTMSESPITKSFELAKLGSAAPRTFHTVVTIAGAPAKVIADCEVDMTPTEVADAGGVAPSGAGAAPAATGAGPGEAAEAA